MQPAGKLSKLDKTQVGQDFSKALKKHCKQAVLERVCLWLSSAKSFFFFFLLKLLFFFQIEFFIYFSMTTFTIFNVCTSIQDIGGKRCMYLFLKLNHHNLKASKWKMSHVREKHTNRKGYNKWEDVILLMIYVYLLPFL